MSSRHRAGAAIASPTVEIDFYTATQAGLHRPSPRILVASIIICALLPTLGDLRPSPLALGGTPGCFKSQGPHHRYSIKTGVVLPSWPFYIFEQIMSSSSVGSAAAAAIRQSNPTRTTTGAVSHRRALSWKTRLCPPLRGKVSSTRNPKLPTS